MSAHAAPVSRGERGPATAALHRFASGSWLAIAIAAALAATSLGVFQGGIESLGLGAQGLTPNITLQMSLTLAAGLAVAAAALRARGGPVWGLGAGIALFVLAAYTAISIAWSVDPAVSWLEASRTFAYAATFAGAVALVRLAPARWRSVLAGVLLATAGISAYALATKVLPESLDVSDPYARLSLPFGYWNAVGLTAALGLPPCLWLGARREGHGVVNALAAPLLCGLLITLLLSLSRGALAAAIVGGGLWFAFVPLRLRGLAVLAIGGATAAAAVAYAYSRPALTDDHVGLGAREYAGHRLGLVILAALLVAFAAALVVRFAAERRPLSPRARRRLGIAVLVAVALVPVAGAAALAHSSRGLTGSLSHAWDQFTNPSATQPSGNPSRLGSAGNDHSLYWSLAMHVFRTSPGVGAGAGAYPIADQRFMTGQALAVNAHSYIFQTLADLGVVGLLLSLALAAAWAVAALRSTGLRRPRAPGGDLAERIGLVTMFAVVAVFVVHSAVDWTWFVPTDAILALLLAGWIAGRGPVAAAPPAPLAPRTSWVGPARARAAAPVAVAVAAIAIGALAAWTQWQPLRSANASNAAAIALGNAGADSAIGLNARARREYATAYAEARAAISRNPLDITALSQLATYYWSTGRERLARETFEREVALQPSNAQSWSDLAYFESGLGTKAGDRAAYRHYATALYLDPQDRNLKREFLSLSPGGR